MSEDDGNTIQDLIAKKGWHGAPSQRKKRSQAWWHTSVIPASGDGGKSNKSSRSAWAKRRKKYIAKRENVDTASLSRVTEQHCGKNAVEDR